MTFEEAENFVHSRSRTQVGGESNISKMRKLMNLLSNPQDNLKFVHIAGTNGKGSTTKMTSEILKNAGYNVGMFISPFIVEFRERFQVNGEMISKEMFVDIAERVFEAVETLEKDGVYMTEFQLVTAIGFEFFNKMNCDVVCLEVGLGGRLDVTNIIKTPILSIITSISLDHTAILGETIKEIANEKAGIIKENSSVVVYPMQENDALQEIIQKSNKTNSNLLIPKLDNLVICDCSLNGSSFTYKKNDYRLNLIGEHQIYNSIAVLEGVEVLKSRGFNISHDDVKNALDNVNFPARFEIISKEPYIVVEGSHNISSFEALANNLKMFGNKRKIVLMGMMQDKDVKSALNILKGVDIIIAVPIDFMPRAMNPLELKELANEVCAETYAFETLQDGIEKAKQIAKKDDLIIFCGSFYLATNVRNYFEVNKIN